MHLAKATSSSPTTTITTPPPPLDIHLQNDVDDDDDVKKPIDDTDPDDNDDEKPVVSPDDGHDDAYEPAFSPPEAEEEFDDTSANLTASSIGSLTTARLGTKLMSQLEMNCPTWSKAFTERFRSTCGVWADALGGWQSAGAAALNHHKKPGSVNLFRVGASFYACFKESNCKGLVGLNERRRKRDGVA